MTAGAATTRTKRSWFAVEDHATRLGLVASRIYPHRPFGLGYRDSRRSAELRVKMHILPPAGARGSPRHPQDWPNVISAPR